MLRKGEASIYEHPFYQGQECKYRSNTNRFQEFSNEFFINYFNNQNIRKLTGVKMLIYYLWPYFIAAMRPVVA